MCSRYTFNGYCLTMVFQKKKKLLLLFKFWATKIHVHFNIVHVFRVLISLNSKSYNIIIAYIAYEGVLEGSGLHLANSGNKYTTIILLYISALHVYQLHYQTVSADV